MKVSSMPLVSVIIPFLNEEKYIADAIESVLTQTYNNWEIVLVDDGSTDNSEALAKKYTQQYPAKIFYTDHPDHENKGLSYSRNRGVAVSNGDLIALLDADDVWLPRKLETQISLMNAHPQAAMLCEAAEFWFPDWPDKSQQNLIKQVGLIQDKLFEPCELLSHLYPLSYGQAPCPSGIIVKKDVVLKHDGFEAQFAGKYQLYEDQAFLHKIYLNEYVYISSFCNHRYRQRENSLVRKIKSDGDYDSVRSYFLEWLEQYLRLNNIQNASINRLLRNALEPYRHPNYFLLKNSLRKLYRKVKG